MEEWVKGLCRVRGISYRVYSQAPLGRLANRPDVRSLLVEKLPDAISQFCRISWNQAKHQYAYGYPKSVISDENAIGGYFVARALGAKVLVVAGRLEARTKVIEDVKCNRVFYTTGKLPRVVDDAAPWSVSDIDFAD